MNDSVRVLDRALDIIESLSRSNKALGPTRLAQQTGIDKSTVYRILNTLCQRGYAEKTEEGAYTIGPKLISLASWHIGYLELQTEARPYLAQLSNDLGLTTHLGILDGWHVIYIEKMDDIPKMQISSQIGLRMPAYCSSLGKCLLSCLSGDELEEAMESCDFKRFTVKTITTLTALKEHLRTVRNQGWAMDDEESEPGHICIGAPIYDYKGDIIAAVSASGAREKISDNYIPIVVRSLQKTAMDISKRMGSDI